MWPLTWYFHFLGMALGSLLQENRISDTTAAEARRGKDIQGIPWDRLSISREKYRQTRLEQYKNYENIPQSGEMSEKVNMFCLEFGCIWLVILKILCTLYFFFFSCLQECKATDKGGKYYDFWQNTRSVKSTILHFQVCWFNNSLLLIMCGRDNICFVYTPCYLVSCGMTCASMYTCVIADTLFCYMGYMFVRLSSCLVTFMWNL